MIIRVTINFTDKEQIVFDKEYDNIEEFQKEIEKKLECDFLFMNQSQGLRTIVNTSKIVTIFYEEIGGF